MVDEERVRLLLRRITDDVAVLRARAGTDPLRLLSDRTRLDAAKYTLVTAIEGCVRVAQHLGASESWRAPTTNADAFRVLTGAQRARSRPRRRPGSGSRARNLLVHAYAELDDTRVVATLGGLGDLDDFVDAVLAWIATQRR